MAPRAAEPVEREARQPPADTLVIGRDGKPLKYRRRDVNNHIAKYTNLDGKQNGEALFYILTTWAAWTACFFLPIWIMPLHSLLTIRLFVTGVHDTAHGSTFNARWMNNLLGTLVGPCTMSPYNYWQWGHDYHHDHSNDLDFQQWSQSAPLTVSEFKSWPAWQRAAYRFFNIPIVMISTVAPLAMAMLQPLSADRALDWAVQLSLWGVLAWYGQLARLLATMGLGACLGVFMFHLQHTYAECVREVGRDYWANGYHGSSLLLVPRWLRFFTAGIEYHHIHHLNAKVPWYNLARCHDEAPPGMWDGIKTISFAEGWAALRLTMFDAARGRLITFAELDADDDAAAAKKGL